MRPLRCAIRKAVVPFLLGLLLVAPLWGESAASAPQKKILLLYSFGYGLPAYQRATPAFLSVMKSGSITTDDLFFEFLDLLRNNDKEHRQYLLDLLRHKYAEHKIDLIITVHGPALNLLLNEGEDISPNAPVLALLAPETINKEGTKRSIVRMPISLDMHGTLERSLELFPETTHIVFVGGFSEVDRRFEREAQNAFVPWQDKLQFEYTSDLSVEEMLQRVANLPPRSIVIYGNLFTDKTGRMFIPRDVGEMVAKTSNAPVFGLYDTLLGTGVIGGSMLSFEAEGSRAGKLALDILNGSFIFTDPFPRLANRKIPMFDWQQIERWKGNAGMLPGESFFVNRDPSFWDRYGNYAIGFIAFSLAQSLMIAALLVHRRRRRLAEDALENQLRFETLLADLSARFVKLSSSEVDREIELALGQVMDFFHADHCGLIGVRPDRKSARVTHAAYAEGIDQVSHDIDLAVLFPWSYRVLIEEGQHASVARMSELPPEADQDRRSFAALGARSSLTIPLFIGEGIGHLISIHAVRQDRVWPEEYLPRLRLLGEIFVNALERKNADLALRESETRLSLAADYADAGVWALDIDTGRFWGTEKAAQLYGFSSAEEDVNFERFLDIVHSEDRDRVHQAVQKVLQEGADFSAGYRIVLPDESIRWVSARGRLHPSPSGKPDHLMGVSIDITALKENQEKVQQATDEWQTTFDSITDMILLLDHELRIIRVNAATVSHLGLPIDRILGKHCHALMYETGEPIDEGLFTKMMQTKKHEEAELYDGRRGAWFLASVDPVLNDRRDITAVVHTVRDITEQKGTQESIKESEEFNRAVLASLKNHIAILDKSGDILSVNDAWEEFALKNGVPDLTGLGPGVNYLEVCRRSMRAGCDLASQALDGVQSVLDGKKDTFALEYPCDSPSEPRWFLMKVMPLRREGGGVVISHTNITQRINAEMESLRRREELAHVTRVITVGELATSLAHEITQPLTAILWNAEAAQRFLSGASPDLEEIRQILDDIIKDDKRAGEVIRRVRPLLKKETPRCEPVDLNETIQESIALACRTSSLEGLFVSSELDAHLPSVQGDRVQLQQVILNLLLNAIDAMKDVPFASRKLVIGATIEGGSDVQVSITDTGTGLDAKNRDRLFEPFYSTKTEGLGVGIWISRTIIHTHGGKIWAENNREGGATFYFTLPLDRGDQP